MKKRSQKIKHAVVLVNYKTAKDTIACVQSIQKTKDAPHIIVVDNGSQDEIIQELRSACPGLDLVSLGVNVGFSASNNIGIKKALRMGAEVVYILNNDTQVDPNLFFRAYRYVAGKNRIAGAKIYYAKGYEYHPERILIGKQSSLDTLELTKRIGDSMTRLNQSILLLVASLPSLARYLKKLACSTSHFSYI